MTETTKQKLLDRARKRHGDDIAPVVNDRTSDGFFVNSYKGWTRDEYWYNTSDGNTRMVYEDCN